MAIISGEQIIARCFKSENVDTIFFMMGGPTGGTAGACLDLGMKGIYVRHEQAAAMMAHAYARVTGKPGICIAPMGPGVVQPDDRARQRVGRCGAGDRDRRFRADARHHARYLPGDGSGSDDEADRQGARIGSTSATASPSTSASRFARRSTASAAPIYLDLPGDILSGKVEEEKIHWVEGNSRTDARPAGDPALIRKARSSFSPRRSKPDRPHRQRRVVVGRARRTARLHRCDRASRFTPRRKAAASSPRIIRARSRARARPRFARPTWCWSSARGRTRCFRSCARRVFRRTPSSSTSTSTARRSATIAPPTSASSATPSWCCGQLTAEADGRFNPQRRERMGRAARRQASLQPGALRAAAAFQHGADPSFAPVQRGQGRHHARHDPGRRRPRDSELRAPVDSHLPGAMQPQRGPARMHGRRHPVRNRRQGRRVPTRRCWCSAATAHSAGTGWRWTPRFATSCRSWWWCRTTADSLRARPAAPSAATSAFSAMTKWSRRSAATANSSSSPTAIRPRDRARDQERQDRAGQRLHRSRRAGDHRHGLCGILKN